MRDHEATVMVIDGLLTPTDRADGDIELKNFIHEVQVLSELAGCTTLLLRGAHSADETYPERTMAGTLELQWHPPQEPLADRLAEMVKSDIFCECLTREFGILSAFLAAQENGFYTTTIGTRPATSPRNGT